MRLEPNPIFRKIFVPWYISRPVLWGLFIAMVIIVIFSLTGITVAQNNPNFHPFIWVPVLLLVLSTIMLIATFVRLLQSSRFSSEE